MTKQPARGGARDCCKVDKTLRRDGDEQAAGGLRVESDKRRGLVHARRNVERGAGILAVALNRAGNHALPEGVHRAVEGRQRAGKDFRAEGAWAQQSAADGRRGRSR